MRNTNIVLIVTTALITSCGVPDARILDDATLREVWRLAAIGEILDGINWHSDIWAFSIGTRMCDYRMPPDLELTEEETQALRIARRASYEGRSEGIRAALEKGACRDLADLAPTPHQLPARPQESGTMSVKLLDRIWRFAWTLGYVRGARDTWVAMIPEFAGVARKFCPSMVFPQSGKRVVIVATMFADFVQRSNTSLAILRPLRVWVRVPKESVITREEFDDIRTLQITARNGHLEAWKRMQGNQQSVTVRAMIPELLPSYEGRLAHVLEAAWLQGYTLTLQANCFEESWDSEASNGLPIERVAIGRAPMDAWGKPGAFLW